MLNSILESINDFVMLLKNRNDLNKTLVKIFEELVDFSKVDESTSKSVDLEAIKYYLGTNFFGFNLTVLKEAYYQFLSHMELYCGHVKPSSGLKAKTMDFFRRMTQKRYRELSEIQKSNLKILKIRNYEGTRIEH